MTATTLPLAPHGKDAQAGQAGACCAPMIGSHAGGEACVCDLTGAFDLTAPTISHHLKIMRTAGLIDGERRGTWIYYRIVPETVNKLGTLFAPLNQPAAAAGGPVETKLVTA